MSRIEVRRGSWRGRWRLAVHLRDRSPRGGMWLYRWAITTPWLFVGWRSRAYDALFCRGKDGSEP